MKEQQQDQKTLPPRLPAPAGPAARPGLALLKGKEKSPI